MQVFHGNFLCTYLSLLNVKYTQSYARRLYDEHPYKYTLFGLYDMLNKYKIKSTALQLNEQTELLQMEPPFIAHLGNDFVVVEHLDDMRIDCFWNNRKVSMPIDKFYRLWSGVVLISEKTEQSVEPGYKQHRRAEWTGNFLQYMVALLLAALWLIGLTIHKIWIEPTLLFSFFLMTFGAYISFLLTLKQLHVHSRQADTVCLFFSRKDCNNVLESSGSRLGRFHWSEIGLGYFMSCMVTLAFYPELLPYVSLINICALPYSLWSVWYQKFKIKQWCPLCLIVQAVLWLQFAADLVGNAIVYPSWKALELMSVLLIYCIPFSLIQIFVFCWKQAQEGKMYKYRYNEMKMRDGVFITLLHQGTYYSSDSIVLLGNICSKERITVLTNPHCVPCSYMHKQIMNLLAETNNGFCVQYVFTSFGGEYDESSRFLIATYLNNSIEQTEKIYSEWFEKGKYDRTSFYAQYDFDTQNPQVAEEWDKHQAWRRQTGFVATPTVLFNGYPLPAGYELADLKYFIHSVDLPRPS